MKNIVLFFLIFISINLHATVNATAQWDLGISGAATFGGSTYNFTTTGSVAFTTQGGFACVAPLSGSNFLSGSSALNTFLTSNNGAYQIEYHWYATNNASLQSFFGFQGTLGGCAAQDQMYLTTGGLSFYQLATAASCNGGQNASSTLNTWHSVIIAYNGTNVFYYYDNSLKTTTAATSYGTASGSFVGPGFGFNMSTGYVRDLVIYPGCNCAGTGTCADYVPSVSNPVKRNSLKLNLLQTN